MGLFILRVEVFEQNSGGRKHVLFHNFRGKNVACIITVAEKY